MARSIFATPPDGTALLSRALQTVAFCLAIAALQSTYQPDGRYEIAATYSVLIGLISWAIIDVGRYLFPSSAAEGWPTGVWGLLLPLVGIVGGFVLGTLLADLRFGWSSWHALNRTQLALSVVLSLLAGLLATYYFYSREMAAVMEKRMAETQRQASDAQLTVLRTQLDPHMLFNTLANLRVLIGIDPAAAQAMLDRMDAYLRATLAASRANEHALADEFARLHDYLELMKVRMGERLRYRLDLPDELAALPVPALLLQPAVENSIRHGLEPKVEGGEVVVRAWRNGRTLHLSVCDTGVGLPAAPTPASTPAPTSPSAANPASSGRTAGGFGLAQLRERLATRFGPDVTIELVANNPSGTCLKLAIELENSAHGRPPHV